MYFYSYHISNRLIIHCYKNATRRVKIEKTCRVSQGRLIFFKWVIKTYSISYQWLFFIYWFFPSKNGVTYLWIWKNMSYLINNVTAMHLLASSRRIWMVSIYLYSTLVPLMNSRRYDNRIIRLIKSSSLPIDLSVVVR